MPEILRVTREDIGIDPRRLCWMFGLGLQPEKLVGEFSDAAVGPPGVAKTVFNGVADVVDFCFDGLVAQLGNRLSSPDRGIDFRERSYYI